MFLLFVNIFPILGFEGRILVLIMQVAGNCLKSYDAVCSRSVGLEVGINKTKNQSPRYFPGRGAWLQMTGTSALPL